MFLATPHQEVSLDMGDTMYERAPRARPLSNWTSTRTRCKKSLSPPTPKTSAIVGLSFRPVRHGSPSVVSRPDSTNPCDAGGHPGGCTPARKTGTTGSSSSNGTLRCAWLYPRRGCARSRGSIPRPRGSGRVSHLTHRCQGRYRGRRAGARGW